MHSNKASGTHFNLELYVHHRIQTSEYSLKLQREGDTFFSAGEASYQIPLQIPTFCTHFSFLLGNDKALAPRVHWSQSPMLSSFFLRKLHVMLFTLIWSPFEMTKWTKLKGKLDKQVGNVLQLPLKVFVVMVAIFSFVEIINKWACLKAHDHPHFSKRKVLSVSTTGSGLQETRKLIFQWCLKRTILCAVQRQRGAEERAQGWELDIFSSCVDLGIFT